MTNKLTKYGIMIIAAVLLVAMAFAGAGAATTEMGWYDNGIASGEFIIATPAELESLSSLVNQGTTFDGETVKLSDDLDMSGIIFIPIGNVSSTPFMGSFDGQGHTISNLYISTTAGPTGLFGTIENASISNLTLKDGSVISTAVSIGCLVGSVKTTSTSGTGLDFNLRKTYQNNTVATGKWNPVGNIINYSVTSENNQYQTHISRITLKNMTSSYKGSSTSNNNYAGLIGWVQTCSSLWIQDCSIDSDSTLLSTTGNGGGGLFGVAASRTSVVAMNCVVSCSINATGDSIGGLFGYLYGNSANNYWSSFYFENCIVNGKEIKSQSKGVMGGLGGRLYDADSLAAVNCKVVGVTISGEQRLGGLIGFVNDQVSTSGTAQVQLENCIVDSVTLISPTGNIGGCIGSLEQNKESLVNLTGCQIINSVLTIQDESDNSAGLIARISYLPKYYEITSCLVSNVTLNGIGSTDLSDLYGFDAEKGNYVFHGYGGGLNVSEIQLTNGNSIKDLVIKNATYPVPNNRNATFNGVANITGMVLGDSWTYTKADAFTGTGITTGVVLPNTASAGYVSWVLLNSTRDAISTLEPSKFMYAAERNGANQEVTLNANGGTPCGKLFVTKNEVPATAPLAEKTGYNFSGWYGEQALTNMVFNDTGVVIKSVSGWTDADGKWIHDGASTLYAKWTAAPAKEFTNTSGTITLDPGYVVVKINVSATTIENISFVYDQSVTAPTRSGYHNQEAFGDAFNITLIDGSFDGGKAKIFFNISKADLGTLNAGNIVLAHFTNGVWEYLSTVKESEDSGYVEFSAETTSFSPFYRMHMIQDAPYTPSSSSSQSGGSVLLQPGQVAPTVPPTVAPTVAPTDKPATPTLAPTAKPTAQQTQASPAPFLGIIAGLGVAAGLLRLRK